MSPSLTHLAFQVEDMEACIAFYRDYSDIQRQQ